MGFRVLLIAVKGKSKQAIHSDFGLEETGEFEEISESPFTGATLPSGVYVLYLNQDILPDERVCATLSGDASVVTCYVNETVMLSCTTGWESGVEKWSVIHDAQQGFDHLEANGDVPTQFNVIRDRLIKAQAEDDGADFIFDIPVELFVACGGVRYDQDIEGADPEPWQILKKTTAGVATNRWWWPFG